MSRERPPHGYRSWRKFKSDKRADLAKLEADFMKFRHGCASIPGYPTAVHAIDRALDKLAKETSIKVWGR